MFDKLLINLIQAFIDGIEAQSKNVSDLSGAVLRAIDLDKKVWSSGVMPDNALTTIVLLTDGRSSGGNQQVSILFFNIFDFTQCTSECDLHKQYDYLIRFVKHLAQL